MSDEKQLSRYKVWLRGERLGNCFDVHLMVDAPNEAEAEERAKRMLTSRQGIFSRWCTERFKSTKIEKI